MSNLLSEEEKEARRLKVEEIRRKMSEKNQGSLSSTPSRTSALNGSASSPLSSSIEASLSTSGSSIAVASNGAAQLSPKNGSTQPPSSSAAPAPSSVQVAAPPFLGTLGDEDVDVDDVERILEKAARLLRDEEDKFVKRSTPPPALAPTGKTDLQDSADSQPAVDSPKSPKTANADEGDQQQKKDKKKKKKTSPHENGEAEGKDKKKRKKKNKEKKEKKERTKTVMAEPTSDQPSEQRASVCGEESGGEELSGGGKAVEEKHEEVQLNVDEQPTAVEQSVITKDEEKGEENVEVINQAEDAPEAEEEKPSENGVVPPEPVPQLQDEEKHNGEEADDASSEVSTSTSTSPSDEDTTPQQSPISSPLSSPSVSAELPEPESPTQSSPSAMRAAGGWQKANLFSPSKADPLRRRQGSARNRTVMLGNRSDSPASPTNKLYRSSEISTGASEDEAEDRRKLQALKDRKSVCYSMQLPSSSGSPPTSPAEANSVFNANLARKWGAARRSGPVHTSFQDLMRLRSASVAYNPELFSGSSILPSSSGAHTMTNKNDEYVVKFIYEGELYKIVCSCEMNAAQIKSAMIHSVKQLLGLDTGKGKEDSESESNGKTSSRPSSTSSLSSSSSGSSSSTSSSPRTSTDSPPLPSQSLEEKDYVLRIPGVNYYFVKEEQSLHLIGVLQVCKKSFVTFPLEMIPRPSTDVLHENDKLNLKDKIMSELNANTEVFELLTNPISGDNPLIHILKSDNDEINSFRKRITKVRRAVLKEREEVVRKAAVAHGNSKYDTSFLPQYRESEPLPLKLPEWFAVQVYQPSAGNDDLQSSTQTIRATRDQTVAELKSAIFRKYKVSYNVAAGSEDDYVLKVTGYKEYLLGNHKLLSYDYIRKCISKKVTPILSLVPLQEVDLMIPEPVEDSVVDMILSREKDPHFSKDRFKDQEARKPISDMVQQLRVKINGVDNVDTFNHIIKSWMREQKGKKEKPSDEKTEKENIKNKTYCLYVCAQIYHGDELIADDMYTNAILYSNGPMWNEWLVSSIKLRDIPRGARMCFTLYRRQLDNTVSAEAVFTEKGKFNEKTDVPLGWVNCQFIDHKDQLRQGLCSFKLWLGKPNPIGTCVENVAVKDKDRATTLHVEFQIHRTTVFFPPPPDLDTYRAKASKRSSDDSTDVAKRKIMKLQVEEIMKKDPLTALSEEQRQLLWDCREFCCQFPALLPRFLQYVKWNDRDAVLEAYRMLALWTPPTPFEALSLLDAKYASPVVRAYAVQRLHELDDRELSDFLLQLVQVLKYEAYHYSPLAEFLLSRALMNVNQIGHAFFWLLKSELHNPSIASRYSLLAEAYLRGCGGHRQELVKQNKVLNQLAKVAMRVKEVPSSEKITVLKEGLKKIDFPSKFLLPLDPRQEVKGLFIDKCKYMDSKKLPLWLVFENAEKRGAPIRVIFKAGDDLRQDVLTLQMIRIMDKLWKEKGLDLRLNAYGCVATGDELGMIEVVLNASTTASVNKERGGSKAVLYKDTLTSWLNQKNPSPEKFETAQENFMLSCAGYCVATYVLGIGDRHNDNIMITEFGHLFHIDFGHFLGNVKSKLGIKRERAPFIFNPQFAHVLGGSKGKRYAQFVETCKQAYTVVRQHAPMFINLFMMMLSTGIPELQCEEDILYLCNSLLVGKDDKEAEETFARLIEEARKTKSVLVNDIVHIWAHSKK